MTRDTDIVVVGAGVTGLATAHTLARTGRAVTVFEQSTIGNDRGGSHGSSRIFRLAYADERYVRLARGALEGWRELEEESGTPLVVTTGSLDVGRQTADIARALATCGVEHELLTGSEASKRWPIRFGTDEPVLFQSQGGVCRADRALATFLAGARRAGAEVFENTRVSGLEITPRGVRVSAGSNEIAANATVVTAGAWAAALLSPMGIELAVIPTRETVSYFARTDTDGLPPLIDWSVPAARKYGVLRAGQASYALPAPDAGLKVGLHHSGPIADPDDIVTPEEGAVSWAAEWVTTRFPETDPIPIKSETCLYTNTSDESFVLERHGRIVVGSACSGHGFKFAPAVGRTLAALACEAAH